MLVKEATKKICPSGSGVYATTETRRNLDLPSNAHQFCAGDQCMGWSWDPGHESEIDTITVWYMENIYPLPTVPDADAPRNDEDREFIAMLRCCHQQIRENIVRTWQPNPPDGDGWELKEKSWEEGTVRPRAVFWRKKTARHGSCGFVRVLRAWQVTQG